MNSSLTNPPMMSDVILTSEYLQFAAEEFADTDVVFRRPDNTIDRYSYVELARRSSKLANALVAAGVKPGDRVATMAWNSYEHLELYFAVSGIGAICHTINPRYSIEQIMYIMQHAEDRALFYAADFAPIVDQVIASCPALEFAVSFEAAQDAATQEPHTQNGIVRHHYEPFIDAASDAIEWPVFEENQGAFLCYTSGTTGNPKGVLYTHRSVLLYSLVACQRDYFDISSHEVVCPIVPMFHVNAWGVPLICAMTGAKLVLPGHDLSAAALFDLIDQEQVSMAFGVPTIWAKFLDHMRELGRKPQALERILVGGAAAPLSMIKAFENEFSITVLHGWGMTETSPLAAICSPKPKVGTAWSRDDWQHFKTKQGRRLFGVAMKIVDENNQAQPHDGESVGELLVRGPWVMDSYFRQESSAHDSYIQNTHLQNMHLQNANNWFATGDIASIDTDGYMKIVDRKKDVIKSGGEWISSVDIENAALNHPAIKQAAVIGLPHPQWSERPLLIVVPDPASNISESEVLQFLKQTLPTWWVPEEVVFDTELPIGATGKILKKELRKKFPAFSRAAITNANESHFIKKPEGTNT